MATLGKNVNTNTNRLPPGNTPLRGVLMPKSKLAEKMGSNGSTIDPSHD